MDQFYPIQMLMIGKASFRCGSVEQPSVAVVLVQVPCLAERIEASALLDRTRDIADALDRPQMIFVPVFLF
jgi:hypothetical protein